MAHEQANHFVTSLAEQPGGYATIDPTRHGENYA